MSDEEDIYKAPEANIVNENSVQYGLASRWSRLAAALFDGALALCFNLVIFHSLGLWEKLINAKQIDYSILLWISIADIVFFLLLHGYSLHYYGQTLGKKLLKIAIVSFDNDRILPISRLIVLRYLPIWVVSLIPILANIIPVIDALFIFRQDKRCIHDLIAGTKVIDVSPAYR